MAWQIKNWYKHYEVNDKNRPARNGDVLRVSALEYIRLKSYGRKQSIAYRRLLDAAGHTKAPEVYGIFCKFLEIAGDCRGDSRGILRNEHDDPANMDDLSYITGFTPKSISNAIEVLTSPTVRWLESLDYPEMPGNAGNSASKSESNHNQNKSNQEKEQSVFDTEAGFEKVWQAWPKSEHKKRKADAKKYYVATKPTKESTQLIIAKIEEYKKSASWIENNGKYIPNPANWLKGAQWNDPTPPVFLTPEQIVEEGHADQRARLEGTF